MTAPGKPQPTPIAHPSQRWLTALDGHRLRHLRRQRGLSQEQLADQSGISLTTIGRLERDPAAPCRSRTLGCLARALGEDPARLTLATHPEHPGTLAATLVSRATPIV